MNDRQLLELAAKAAGYSLYESDTLGLCRKTMVGAIAVDCNQWNPLADDGDALRLAVKLAISGNFTGVEMHKSYAVAHHNYRAYGFRNTKDYESDPYAAIRRVIVTAAAQIGKEMA